MRRDPEVWEKECRRLEQSSREQLGAGLADENRHCIDKLLREQIMTGTFGYWKPSS